MIITDDKELAIQAKHLTTTAKVPHKWEYVHDKLGYNYRMPNLNASLGCAQLKRLEEFLIMKRELYESYRKQFFELDGFRLFSEPPDCYSNYWLQTIILINKDNDLRDKVLAGLNNAGLMSRPAWNCL